MPPKSTSMTVEEREAKRREVEERVKAMLASMEVKKEPTAVSAAEPQAVTIENKPIQAAEATKAEQIEAKKAMLRERVKSTRAPAPTDELVTSASEKAAEITPELIPASASETRKPVVHTKVHPSALPSNDSAAVAQLRAKLHAAKSDAERLTIAVEITTQRYPLKQDAQRALTAKLVSESTVAKEVAAAKAQKEAEAAAKKEAEEKAKAEAKAQKEAEAAAAKAQKEAEAAAKKEAEDKAKAEAKAQKEAEAAAAKAQKEAEAAAKKEAEDKAEAEAKAQREAEAAAKKAAEEAERAAVEAFPDVSVHDTKVHGVVAKKKASMRETPEEAETRRRKAAEERERMEADAKAYRESKAKEEKAAKEREQKALASSAATVATVEVGHTTEAAAAAARAERERRRKEEEEAEREVNRKLLEEQRAAKRASFHKAVEERTKSAAPAVDKNAGAVASEPLAAGVQDVFTELKEQTDATYAKLEAEALAKVALDTAASERERQRAVAARLQREEERKAALLASKSKRASSNNLKSTFVEKKAPEAKGRGKLVVSETSADASLSKTVTPGMWVLLLALGFFVIAALAR